MQRVVFLQDPDVREMLAWLRERFDTNQKFIHTYTGRKGKRSWRCNGLFEAFQSYEWNVKDWQANKAELDSFRERLRGAVTGGDEESAVACSERSSSGAASSRRTASRSRHGGGTGSRSCGR